MAQIYVPVISPFSVTGPLHDADDSHIQSHHVAYEIAALSRHLDALIAEYDTQVSVVKEIQAKNASSTKLKAAEKKLMASLLPHQIKTLRAKLKELNADLRMMTR